MSTVTVACKLPNGLILDIPGAKEPVVLNGANHPDAIAGHGLTEVPADFWEAWTKLYPDFQPLKKELIFAQGGERSAISKAKERKGEKSGLEGLDPDKPGKGLERVPDQKN
ncbi:hypothetical protein NAT65_26045 [Achromobacter xylosoxidans]|jgi:hypothetical protein|uniref:hypothetical protein n=1 Tax=Alcaligenes xylosoxydans xylosoxydans TaxID=85698 RepID=UPI0006C6CB1F|nr:hypothetical protein [Achromobacter xylosoxidans]MCM2574564.1 hypothetical protein [Achromobacter xylosoxidans]MCZ8436881.1 hypothetical protein [Achromobacter xylosoxidans]CUJ66514.1 Uncharacterised protein [Achromobacter xylosoxidans]